MGCRKATSTWAQNLKVGAEYRQYTVQLVRQIGCFNEEYRIYVNGQEIEEHGLSNSGLKYKFFSPLCHASGEFEWEQDGHSFRLVLYALSLTTVRGEFRLFIDGIDVNSGREFSAFWRRRGWQIVSLGLVFLLLGITLALIFHYAVPSPQPLQRLGVSFSFTFIFAGLFDIVWGLIPVIKYRKPRKIIDLSPSNTHQKPCDVNGWSNQCEL